MKEVVEVSLVLYILRNSYDEILGLTVRIMQIAHTSFLA